MGHLLCQPPPQGSRRRPGQPREQQNAGAGAGPGGRRKHFALPLPSPQPHVSNITVTSTLRDTTADTVPATPSAPSPWPSPGPSLPSPHSHALATTGVATASLSTSFDLPVPFLSPRCHEPFTPSSIHAITQRLELPQKHRLGISPWFSVWGSRYNARWWEKIKSTEWELVSKGRVGSGPFWEQERQQKRERGPGT